MYVSRWSLSNYLVAFIRFCMRVSRYSSPPSSSFSLFLRVVYVYSQNHCCVECCALIAGNDDDDGGCGGVSVFVSGISLVQTNIVRFCTGFVFFLRKTRSNHNRIGIMNFI